MRIRAENAADPPRIAAVTACAFTNAPHTSHTEQFIINALRAAGQLSLSLVAEADGALVGHIALSPVRLSEGDSGWFGLGPVSVLPQYQRRGIGSLLIREALDILCQRGAHGCVVLGEPQFYGRFGFRADPAVVLPDVPPEYFQSVSFDGSRPRGIATYHEAFNATD